MIADFFHTPPPPGGFLNDPRDPLDPLHPSFIHSPRLYSSTFKTWRAWLVKHQTGVVRRTRGYDSYAEEQEEAGLTRQTFAWLTTVSFLLGAVCSAASGYVGMWAGAASIRTRTITRLNSRLF